MTGQFKYKKKKKLGNYPNLSVVLSITLALFVIGLFGLTLLHTKQLMGVIKENVEIHIYLNKNITENQRIRLEKSLASKKYINRKDDIMQITYVSRDSAAKEIIAETGENFLAFLGENPLRDVYRVGIDQAYQSDEDLETIKNDIQKLSSVFEVDYPKNHFSSISKATANIGLVLSVIALLLLIAIVVLINKAIKLALFSQRFLIRSMQLVGATAGFIRKPFLGRAIIHGMIGGISACLMLIAFLQYAYNKVDGLTMLQNKEEILILFIILIILGINVSFFSAYKSVNKYLKRSLADLY